MKTPRILLVLALATAGVGLVQAADKKAKEPSPVDVTFVDRDKFTDARDGYMGTDRGRDDVLERLKDHLTEKGAKVLQAGQKLAISITEVDLAGEFEPWRGSQWSDVRIVKEIYPPRINLTYKLTAADGSVVKEGKRELRDTAFMMKITGGFRDDSLRYEKEMLDDWLREDIRADKKA
jgi:hypothetical protein